MVIIFEEWLKIWCEKHQYEFLEYDGGWAFFKDKKNGNVFPINENKLHLIIK